MSSAIVLRTSEYGYAKKLIPTIWVNDSVWATMEKKHTIFGTHMHPRTLPHTHTHTHRERETNPNPTPKSIIISETWHAHIGNGHDEGSILSHRRQPRSIYAPACSP